MGVLVRFEKRTDPWGQPRPMLRVGQLVRFPGGRVWVISYISDSRAHAHPLTPVMRVISVPDRKNRKKAVQKEVMETGDPVDIAPTSILESVSVEDLTEAEMKRLTQYVEAGGEVEGLDTSPETGG